MTRICTICPAEFTPKNVNHMICSDACRKASRGGAWVAVRKYTKEYYKDTCAHCKHIGGCDVHHIKTVAEVGVAAHVFENLMVLCRPCHIEAHKQMRKNARSNRGSTAE